MGVLQGTQHPVGILQSPDCYLVAVCTKGHTLQVLCDYGRQCDCSTHPGMGSTLEVMVNIPPLPPPPCPLRGDVFGLAPHPPTSSGCGGGGGVGGTVGCSVGGRGGGGGGAQVQAEVQTEVEAGMLTLAAILCLHVHLHLRLHSSLHPSLCLHVSPHLCLRHHHPCSSRFVYLCTSQENE